MGAGDECVKTAICTQLPAFQNDIADVIRLFFGEGAAVGESEPAQAQLCHEHALEGNMWRETCTLRDGARQETCTLCAPSVPADAPGGALEEKRQLKRLVKRCCYQVLKAYTGRHPAWGSLTGIRPTRLYYQQLEGGATRAQARETLKAQFDLSDEKIGLLDEILDAQEGLINRDPSACDLYVGIPFCTTRCAYCSFSSGEIGDGKLVEPYLAALFREIEACAAMARDQGLSIRVAYIGGGTPSSLTTPQLDRLLTTVERHFGAFDEWTVEAGRPDTLDREKLAMMRDHPVTRISINPQTMNDETLVRIGRAHTARQVVEACELARSLGFDDINMDVIAALPGEDYAMFQRTLECIKALAPESLTVHTLAIKRSSKLHEQGYQQSERDVAQMVRLGRAYAHAMDMRAYYLYRQKYMAENLENVGYAKAGHICRYNIDNMEETTSVLALGAGGISKCVMRQEEKILRAPNIAHIGQYIERVEEMIARKRDAFEMREALLHGRNGR